MALFESFFKPKWQHRDARVRKTAVAELTDQDILAEIVKTDPDPEVRSQALTLVSSGDKLDQLIDTLASPEQKALQKQARKQRLQQLLPSPDTLATISDDNMLLRIASLTADDHLREAAIDQLSGTATRLDIARHHPVAKVRLTAARGIHDPDSLQQLMQEAQGKDKALYRYCKDQIKIHKTGQQVAEQRKAQIQQLAEKAKHLAKSAETADYNGRYQLIRQQWQAVSDHASQQQREHIEQHLSDCAARIAEKSALEAAEEEQQATVAEAQQTFANLASELANLNSTPLPDDKPGLSKLMEQLDRLQHCWQDARAKSEPPAQLAKTFHDQLHAWRLVGKTLERLARQQDRLRKLGAAANKVDRSDFLALQQLQQRTEKLLATLSWPESHAALPGALTQLRSQNDKLNEYLNTLKQNEQKVIESLQSAMDELQNCVDDNQLKSANQAHDTVKKLLQKLDPKKQQQFQSQWRQLTNQLHDIRDWQGFAIEPKKVSLCERMEALINNDDDTDTLADKIQALQAEWKQLGAISARRDQELWQRFNRAADQAWQPCREAFSEQAEARKQNLQKRLQLIDQLTEYEAGMDWSNANWKTVQETLDTARKAFRDIGPTERAGAKSSQQAFQIVSDKIYSHIKEEYERNIASKTALVERAKTIASACAPDKDIKPATEQIKLLQSQWKQIGITPVRADRELWKDFRAACDAVFNHLGEQRQQHKAEIDAQVAQAEQLVHQAQALLEQNNDNPDPHLENRIGELQQTFRDIDLPKGAHIRLSKEFADIERQAQASARMMRQQRLRDSWQYLQNKLTACAIKTTDADTATSLWQQAGELPKGVNGDALDAWWQQGTADADEQQLRELCIAMEILVDIDSPEQDRQARMEWQVKRLASAMGQQRDDQAQSLVSLVNNCIALRPPNEWLQRFCKGLEKAHS